MVKINAILDHLKNIVRTFEFLFNLRLFVFNSVHSLELRRNTSRVPKWRNASNYFDIKGGFLLRASAWRRCSFAVVQVFVLAHLNTLDLLSSCVHIIFFVLSSQPLIIVGKTLNLFRIRSVTRRLRALRLIRETALQPDTDVIFVALLNDGFDSIIIRNLGFGRRLKLSNLSDIIKLIWWYYLLSGCTTIILFGRTFDLSFYRNKSNGFCWISPLLTQMLVLFLLWLSFRLKAICLAPTRCGRDPRPLISLIAIQLKELKFKLFLLSILSHRGSWIS